MTSDAVERTHGAHPLLDQHGFTVHAYLEELRRKASGVLRTWVMFLPDAAFSRQNMRLGCFQSLHPEFEVFFMAMLFLHWRRWDMVWRGTPMGTLVMERVAHGYFVYFYDYQNRVTEEDEAYATDLDGRDEYEPPPLVCDNTDQPPLEGDPSLDETIGLLEGMTAQHNNNDNDDDEDEGAPLRPAAHAFTQNPSAASSSSSTRTTAGSFTPSAPSSSRARRNVPSPDKHTANIHLQDTREFMKRLRPINRAFYQDLRQFVDATLGSSGTRKNKGNSVDDEWPVIRELMNTDSIFRHLRRYTHNLEDLNLEPLHASSKFALLGYALSASTAIMVAARESHDYRSVYRAYSLSNRVQPFPRPDDTNPLVFMVPSYACIPSRIRQFQWPHVSVKLDRLGLSDDEIAQLRNLDDLYAVGTRVMAEWKKRKRRQLRRPRAQIEVEPISSMREMLMDGARCMWTSSATDRSGPYMAAVRRFGERLQEKGKSAVSSAPTLSHPSARHYDMDPFCDLVLSLHAYMTTLGVDHRPQMLTLLIAFMSAPHDRKFQTNILQHGHTDRGKSYTTGEAVKMLIPDSYTCITYESKKAGMDGNDQRAMIHVYDEGAVKIFGENSQLMNSMFKMYQFLRGNIPQTCGDVSMEHEKQRATNRVLEYWTNMIVNGDRITLKQVCVSYGCFVMSGNPPRAMLQGPIESRHTILPYIIRATESISKNAVDDQVCMVAQGTRADWRIQTQRTQLMIHCYEFMLNYGIAPSVNVGLAKPLVDNIYKALEWFRVPRFRRNRTFEKLIEFIRAGTLMRAAHITCDEEIGGPDPLRRFEWTDAQYMIPFLFTPRTLVYFMTVLVDSWNLDMHTRVLEALNIMHQRASGRARRPRDTRRPSLFPTARVGQRRPRCEDEDYEEEDASVPQRPRVDDASRDVNSQYEVFEAFFPERMEAASYFRKVEYLTNRLYARLENVEIDKPDVMQCVNQLLMTDVPSNVETDKTVYGLKIDKCDLLIHVSLLEERQNLILNAIRLVHPVTDPLGCPMVRPELTTADVWPGLCKFDAYAVKIMTGQQGYSRLSHYAACSGYENVRTCIEAHIRAANETHHAMYDRYIQELDTPEGGLPASREESLFAEDHRRRRRQQEDVTAEMQAEMRFQDFARRIQNVYQREQNLDPTPAHETEPPVSVTVADDGMFAVDFTSTTPAEDAFVGAIEILDKIRDLQFHVNPYYIPNREEARSMEQALLYSCLERRHNRTLQKMLHVPRFRIDHVAERELYNQYLDEQEQWEDRSFLYARHLSVAQTMHYRFDQVRCECHDALHDLSTLEPDYEDDTGEEEEEEEEEWWTPFERRERAEEDPVLREDNERALAYRVREMYIAHVALATAMVCRYLVLARLGAFHYVVTYAHFVDFLVRRHIPRRTARRVARTAFEVYQACRHEHVLEEVADPEKLTPEYVAGRVTDRVKEAARVHVVEPPY